MIVNVQDDSFDDKSAMVQVMRLSPKLNASPPVVVISSVVPSVTQKGLLCVSVSAASTLSGITQPLSEIVESAGSGGMSAGSLEASPSEYGTGSSAVDTSAAPKATPISTSFQPQVISGVVEPEFAAKFSFVPPQEGKLDVSKAFQFINQPLSVVNDRSQVAKISNTRAKSNYGGYGTASQQNAALASLIQTNANKYSEYFS